MEVFDWQQRDSITPVLTHIVAGSLAGISEHLSMIPVDNIKTHCQAGRNKSITKIAQKIYKAGGLSNFYAGSSVMIAGCAPAHAIYFSIYQKFKKDLNCVQEQDSSKFAIVGAVSAMFHDLIMTPTETLKQRLQLLKSVDAKISIKEATKTIYRRQGLMAFYRSFPVNYAMNIPFGSLIVVFNEKLKHWFGLKEGDQGFNFYLCGAAAGGIASIPTTPLDVIKTKLNTQNCGQNCKSNHCQKLSIFNLFRQKIDRVNSNIENEIESKLRRGLTGVQNQQMSTVKDVKYRNIMDTLRIIWQEEGITGFFKGMKMRVMIQSTSSGIAWGTYQIIKQMLVQPVY